MQYSNFSLGKSLFILLAVTFDKSALNKVSIHHFICSVHSTYSEESIISFKFYFANGN